MWESLLKALMQPASVSPSGNAVGQFMTSDDETVILDMLPNLGDRALGALRLQTGGENSTGRVRYVIPKVGDASKRPAQTADFTMSRLEGAVAQQWVARTRVLFETRIDGAHRVTHVPRHPQDFVANPTDEQLRLVPGALEAHKGLHALPLEVWWENRFHALDLKRAQHKSCSAGDRWVSRSKVWAGGRGWTVGCKRWEGDPPHVHDTSSFRIRVIIL